jgi:hypothetical protein
MRTRKFTKSTVILISTIAVTAIFSCVLPANGANVLNGIENCWYVKPATGERIQDKCDVTVEIGNSGTKKALLVWSDGLKSRIDVTGDFTSMRTSDGTSVKVAPATIDGAQGLFTSFHGITECIEYSSGSAKEKRLVCYQLDPGD